MQENRNICYFVVGLFLTAVLRKVMAGPTGNYVITVDGNLEFKETIKVNKKTEGAQERLEDYTFGVRIHKVQKTMSEGLMAVSVCVMTPCSLTGRNRRVRGPLSGQESLNTKMTTN